MDKSLAKRYPTIKMQYSKKAHSKYMDNSCRYCGAIQGKNYAVQVPDEIMEVLYDEKPYMAMKRYTIGAFTLKEGNVFKSELKRYFDEYNSYVSIAEDASEEEAAIQESTDG